MIYANGATIIKQSTTQVKENLNVELMHHLLQLTPLNQLSPWAKKLRNALEENMNETDLGFGNYVGEIFERFDEKKLTEIKDVKTLLYYLTIISGREEENLLFKEIFLYNQQDIFETKVVPYLEKEDLFNFYVMLKANGMFEKLELPLPTKQQELIGLLEKFDFSNLFLQVDYFSNHLTKVVQDWHTNGFDFSLEICDEYFIKFIIDFLQSLDDKKINKNLLKYFKALSGNPTEKRLDYIVDYHSNQSEEEIILTLMGAMTGHWRSEGYEEKRSIIRLFMDKCKKYILDEQKTVDEIKHIMGLMTQNNRFSEVYREEYQQNLTKKYRGLTSSKFNHVKKLFLGMDYNYSSYSMLTFDETFNQEIFQKIINQEPLTFDNFSFDLTDQFDSYLVVRVIYNKMCNEITNEEKEKLSKIIPTFEVNENVSYTASMLVKVIFMLRDYSGIREILMKYLTLSTIKEKNDNLFTEEYLIKFDYSNKSFSQLVIDIAKEEDLTIPAVISSMFDILKAYYTSFHRDGPALKIEIAIYAFNIVQTFMDTSYYHQEFLNKLIRMEDFIEYFNSLEDEEKQEIIKFLDNHSVSRHDLFATEEELLEKEKKKIRKLFNEYRYYTIDYISKYDELEDESKKNLFVEIFMQEYLKNILDNGKTALSAIQLVKKLIGDNKVEANQFWELV